MVVFVLQRLASSVVLLALLSFLLFALLGLMPGDPLDAMLAADPRLTPADVANLKVLYGLDKPLGERYLHWVQNVLKGDFGYSRLHNKPVLAVLLSPLLASLKIMLPAFLLALLFALALALPAALHPGRKWDKAATIVTLFSIALPTFWVGIVLLLVFSVQYRLLPGSVLQIPAGAGFWQAYPAYVLPVVTLLVGMIGGYIRYAKRNLAEVLPMPYLRTALAKGASPRQRLLRHGLRNAALPLITVLALSFGNLFSGALITETLFGISGLGRMIFDAINGNDYNLALAGLLFATSIILLCNIAADVAYARLDPRIRFGANHAA
jgi:peptide/nickel transport system permease protein